MILDQQLITKALQIATKAHAHQQRKYTFQPYIIHPVAVAQTIALLPEVTTNMICAALLHDTIEDTLETADSIAFKVGLRISNLVIELTNSACPWLSTQNREARKQYEARRLYFMSNEAQTIKVADLMDNTKTIVAFDPKFAKVYLAEKEVLLSTSLTQANPLLLHLAWQQLRAMQMILSTTKEEKT